MAKAYLPFGAWMPDQASFENPGSDTIFNVVPRTADAYGPAPDMAPVTDALDGVCQGAIYVRDSAGNVHGFAGTADKLYHIVASTTWTDVSKTGGYTTDPDERWEFSVNGERIIATNFSDPIQSFVMNVDTLFSDLSADAPNARYIAQVKDFVMVANTSDGVDGPVPQRVWWPAIDDPTDWPAIGSDAAAEVQSDQQDLVGDGGWNMGIVGGLSAADAVIFQERRLVRAVYVGPPAVFSFTTIADGRGTPAPGSIIAVGEEVYYLADNGFYKTDGVSSVGVGDGMVDKTFWGMVDTSFLFRVTSAVDPVNKLIYWAFPGPQNNGGTPNYIIVLNYDLNRWSLLQQMTEVMIRALSVGYTLDQLDPFGNLETLPFSLDSRAWTGGRLNLACFNTSHEMAIFAGAPLAATIDTSESSLNPKGLAHVSRIWPLVDASPGQLTSTVQGPLIFVNDSNGPLTFVNDSGGVLTFTVPVNVTTSTSPITVTMGQRNRLGDPVVWRTQTQITNTTGSATLRSTAVFQRARVNIPAGTSWNFAQGIQVDAVPAGSR